MNEKTLYQAAYRFYQAGRYSESRDLFSLLTLKDASNKRSWIGFGASLQMLGHYEEAIRSYSVAGLLDPEGKDPKPSLHAGECHLSLKQHTHAMTALKTSLQIATKEQKGDDMINYIQFLMERKQ